jgi:hypothetical protein
MMNKPKTPKRPTRKQTKEQQQQFKPRPRTRPQMFDVYAAAAMAGLLSRVGGRESVATVSDIVDTAFELAEIMMRAKEKRGL